MGTPFDPYTELLALGRALDAAGLEYALCGGLAHLDAVREVARSLGYTFAALPMRLQGEITLWRLTRLIGPYPLMLDLHLLPEGLTEVFDQRVRIPVEGGSLQVVTREGLIVLKTTAGRAQDLVDIQRLMELERD